MANQELKSKRGEILRAWFDFVFGFENKKGDVLGHWIAFHDDFSFPPQEFYAAIEKELLARKIPGMEISREEFAEGGLISDKRIYLRLLRERLALYTCAAPFGSGYFFSCRTVYVPALVRLWHIVAALVFFNIVGGLLVKPLGVTFATIAMIALMFALAGVLRNAAASALSDLDALLLKIPVRFDHLRRLVSCGHLLSPRYAAHLFAANSRNDQGDCRGHHGGKGGQTGGAVSAAIRSSVSFTSGCRHAKNRAGKIGREDMPTAHEQFSEQFRRWELRGRGWQVFDEPVHPEPPFVPFPRPLFPGDAGR